MDQTQEPIRNEELFRAVADQIRQYPQSHDQESWIRAYRDDADPETNMCGTVACVAGHAALLAGAKALRTHNGGVDCFSMEHRGVRRDIRNIAVEELGLTDAESHRLFSAAAVPKHEMTWPEALEKIAVGAEIDDVIGYAPVEE